MPAFGSGVPYIWSHLNVSPLQSAFPPQSVAVASLHVTTAHSPARPSLTMTWTFFLWRCELSWTTGRPLNPLAL